MDGKWRAYDEANLVAETLTARFSRELPEQVIGDAANDGDHPRRRDGTAGIDVIAHPFFHVGDARLRMVARSAATVRAGASNGLFAWLLLFVVTRHELELENFLA